MKITYNQPSLLSFGNGAISFAELEEMLRWTKKIPADTLITQFNIIGETIEYQFTKTPPEAIIEIEGHMEPEK